MTPTPEFVELAGARARIRELETALRQWYDALLDKSGAFRSEAELRLYILADKLPALPADEVTP